MTGNNSGSCFVFQGPVCRLWVPVFLFCSTSSCYAPIFHNASPKYCQRITKNGLITKNKTGERITNKRANGITSNVWSVIEFEFTATQ